MPPIPTQDAALEAATMRRVFSRLLPFLVLAYLICYIDRVNVGFAGLQMNQDLGLTKTIFGLGGGIFFIGYFLLEVPSNLALERFGASRWIARIMISWGIVSGAMVFTAGTNSFLTLWQSRPPASSARPCPVRSSASTAGSACGAGNGCSSWRRSPRC